MSVSRSRPLRTGIWTSAMTQAVPFTWADRRKSSADANVCTVYPCDLRRLLVAARTDASSSMTEIIEIVDKEVLPEAGQSACPSTAARPKNGPQIKVVKLYLGLFALGFDAVNSERFGLSHQIG